MTVNYLSTLTQLKTCGIVTYVEEKKQQPPAAYRVPKAIAEDFENFVEAFQSRREEAHKGHIAAAGLLAVMLADETTQDELLSLVVTYSRGKYLQPKNVKLDLARFRKTLQSGGAAHPPSPPASRSKKKVANEQ